VDVFALNNGRIGRKDTYLDWQSLNKQIGRPFQNAQPPPTSASRRDTGTRP